MLNDFLEKSLNSILFSHSIAGSKRQRISVETDHETGSESSPSSPRRHHNKNSVSFAQRVSPTRTHPPSSPESDLDVDSAPDDVAPENLSLKKENSKSPVLTGNAGVVGFMPYHTPVSSPYSGATGLSTSPSHRSPVDVLIRCVVKNVFVASLNDIK